MHRQGQVAREHMDKLTKLRTENTPQAFRDSREAATMDDKTPPCPWGSQAFSPFSSSSSHQKRVTGALNSGSQPDKDMSGWVVNKHPIQPLQTSEGSALIKHGEKGENT